MANLEEIAHRWIAAFNNHNIGELLSLYSDDARHYSPRVEQEDSSTKGWLVGKEQLSRWWQGSFDRLPDLTYELISLAIGPVDQQRGMLQADVFMRYTRKVSGQPRQDVMEYLHVENELIMESRVLRSWVLDK